MAVRATDRLRTIEEFHYAIAELARGEPVAKPEKMPLAHRMPAGTARELPNERGFLRVVQGSGEALRRRTRLPPVAPNCSGAVACGDRPALRRERAGGPSSWSAPKRDS